jgi:hypothetical protein
MVMAMRVAGDKEGKGGTVFVDATSFATNLGGRGLVLKYLSNLRLLIKVRGTNERSFSHYLQLALRFSPYIVALVCKNPSYIACTRYSCNLSLIYIKV